MTKIIEKLEHGIMVCSVTGTTLVHINKGDAKKIVALLKEQEPVIPGYSLMGKHFICPNCSLVLDEIRDYYCPSCGKKIAWDKTDSEEYD